LLAALKRFAKRFRYKGWSGYCPICERRVRFIVLGPWYRDQLLCDRCFSIPRERALISVVQSLYPRWRELAIHESSPRRSASSLKLARESVGYIASHYVPGAEPGSAWNGFVVQDLEKQTFADEAFGMVITQDVFEHLFDPGRAIREIVRTLRPGGAHIMTVPIVRKSEPSRCRASLDDGEVVHHLEPEWHGNPLGGGSLVTIDWGYDIADYLAVHSGCATSIHSIEDRGRGICAEYIEVVVTRKGAVPIFEADTKMDRRA
jgi:SAM-dependent methyltransferase